MITVHVPEPWATLITCAVLFALPSLWIVMVFTLMALVDAIRCDVDVFGLNQRR